MRLPSIALAALIGLSASPGALAQTKTGSVTVLATPPGSVLILRGGQTYQLSLGDTLFEGDLIFTRSNGTTQFEIDGCKVRLNGEQSILVKLPDVCTVAPTTLASSDVVGGITVGTGAPVGVGATPVLLGALALGGGAAAAAAAGGTSDTPSSP